MKHFNLPKDGGLIDKNIPKGILHNYEAIYTEIAEDSSVASVEIADIIVKAIRDHQASGEKRPFKLGLTTGVTPISLYRKLARRYRQGDVSFHNVEVFSIDEYYPSSPDAAQSRNRLLHDSLLDLVDIPKENIHIPDGTIPPDQISEYCARFDTLASHIDLLVIGIGANGQVGFNEAGSSPRSHSRVVMLSYESRKRQSENFNGNIADTPKQAITLGIGTMMSAKKIILMAWGEAKASVVRDIVEGPATTAAVVWLCQKVNKPILKLTHQDYLENSLGELLDKFGSYSAINIKVFNDLQHTISGWPGGKPGAIDDNTRPVQSTPFPKKVLIFSPHPDDDVISMGGTFIRLVHQGHDVHVAYETSGNVAVHDDVVIQIMDAAHQLGFADKVDEVRKIIATKRPGEPEPRALLDIKGAIRRSEARGAVRSFGLNDDTNVHFLNLPFYESGGVKKNPCTQEDIDIIKKLVLEIKPDQIYMAGDLADPHGTHRVCTEAALEAIGQLKEAGETWLEKTNIWLYRGAWMEWELDRVDMAVPLSPDELVEKRHAIFRHLSQKDIVPFPGDDTREFWQRAEERTQNTAKLYDHLGMAEYQAIEVFLKLC